MSQHYSRISTSFRMTGGGHPVSHCVIIPIGYRLETLYRHRRTSQRQHPRSQTILSSSINHSPILQAVGYPRSIQRDWPSPPILVLHSSSATWASAINSILPCLPPTTLTPHTKRPATPEHSIYTLHWILSRQHAQP